MANFVKPYKNDPFVGHLSTPITTSAATRAILGNLPAYRPGLSSTARGLEVGMAHGYFIVGPFDALGPLRKSDISHLASFMSAAGLIIILSVGLAIYGNATFTSADKAEGIQSKKGWSEFTGGFTVGAFGGAAVAYFLLSTLK
jgi:photosystem I subunit 11